MSNTPFPRTHSLMRSLAISITCQTSLGLTLDPSCAVCFPQLQAGFLVAWSEERDISSSFLSTLQESVSALGRGRQKGQEKKGKGLQLTKLRLRALLATDIQCSLWYSFHYDWSSQ